MLNCYDCQIPSAFVNSIKARFKQKHKSYFLPTSVTLILFKIRYKLVLTNTNHGSIIRLTIINKPKDDKWHKQ